VVVVWGRRVRGGGGVLRDRLLDHLFQDHLLGESGILGGPRTQTIKGVVDHGHIAHKDHGHRPYLGPVHRKEPEKELPIFRLVDLVSPKIKGELSLKVLQKTQNLLAVRTTLVVEKKYLHRERREASYQQENP
jgi:hypothetical protein